MSWTWVTQVPHPSSAERTTLHILVGNDEYLAFVTVDDDHGTPQFRAMVPNVVAGPRGREGPLYHYTHYTHDTLQDAKDWCIAKLVDRRLS